MAPDVTEGKSKVYSGLSVLWPCTLSDPIAPLWYYYVSCVAGGLWGASVEGKDH